jgi:hypothetical protein
MIRADASADYQIPELLLCHLGSLVSNNWLLSPYYLSET